MTDEKRKGFLLGIASKGFLKGGGSKLVTAKLLKPKKYKVILTVRDTEE